MNQQHPLAVELLAATTYEPGTEAIYVHIAGCAMCRAEFDLLKVGIEDGETGPDDVGVRRILHGAATLPSALTNADDDLVDGEPAPGELWRIGTSEEALLVWVANVMGDTAHIVPMMFDLNMADDFSVYVDADASPLGIDAILLYDLTRILPLSVFLNRIGPLDLPREVGADYRQLVGAATIGETLAFPIQNPHDARIEPRLEIEEFLETLAMRGSTPHTVGDWDYQYTFEALRADLRERIFGSDLHSLQRKIFPISQTHTLTCLAKVTHLQRSTVVAALTGTHAHSVFNAGTLAAPCREILRLEPDSSAVAVVIPVDDWVTALFTGADTNPAFAAPAGARVGPTATYIGHGFVDTMHKFLDGRVAAWEDAGTAPTRLNTYDIDEVVERHAKSAVQAVRRIGSRARAPKKDVWSELPASTDRVIARFVHALLNDTPVSEALKDLWSPGFEDVP